MGSRHAIRRGKPARELCCRAAAIPAQSCGIRHPQVAWQFGGRGPCGIRAFHNEDRRLAQFCVQGALQERGGTAEGLGEESVGGLHLALEANTNWLRSCSTGARSSVASCASRWWAGSIQNTWQQGARSGKWYSRCDSAAAATTASSTGMRSTRWSASPRLFLASAIGKDTSLYVCLEQHSSRRKPNIARSVPRARPVCPPCPWMHCAASLRWKQHSTRWRLRHATRCGCSHAPAGHPQIAGVSANDECEMLRRPVAKRRGADGRFRPSARMRANERSNPSHLVQLRFQLVPPARRHRDSRPHRSKSRTPLLVLHLISAVNYPWVQSNIGIARVKSV